MMTRHGRNGSQFTFATVALGILLGATACLLPGSALAQEDGGHADAAEATLASEESEAALSHRVVHDGIAVELEILPRGEAGETVSAGDEMWIRMWLYDAEKGEPLEGMRPAAWVDFNQNDYAAADSTCKARIGDYLPKRMKTRPVEDLNSYVVLGMNRGNHISVIDPFFGFGSTQLLTTILLPGQGGDWVAGPRERLLYVTIPRRNLVAVASTDSWDVTSEVPVGTRPGRITLGPDGRLWVAIDGGEDSGIEVLDRNSLETVARLSTGDGEHEIAFSSGGDRAFVSNAGDGTVSVIDVEDLEIARTIETGTSPVDLEVSGTSDRLYVVDEEDGTVMVVDTRSLEPVARLTGSPGLWRVQFDPTGRWGFVLNGRTDEVHILDATRDRIEHGLASGGRPDHVAFTDNFAYVRSLESADVMMVSLRSLEPGREASAFAEDFGQEESAPIVRTEGGAAAILFPAGQEPPGGDAEPPLAPAITRAPHKPDAVYVPNASEQSVYFYDYMEGMPTPAGNLKIDLSPKAVMTLGRHLKEQPGTPGLYTAAVEAPEQGEYSFNFLLDEPRIVECFPFDVEESTRVAEGNPEVRLEPAGDTKLTPGQESRIRFRVLERTSGDARPGLRMEAQVASPTGWITRAETESEEDGAYAVSVTVPETGPYYLSVRIPSLGKSFRSQQPVVLHATRAERAERTDEGVE